MVKILFLGIARNRRVQTNMKRYCIDLFAGCGGLSLGLENAGFEPLLVNELADEARESYLINRRQYKRGRMLRR
jgi:site-specific DNA-cytosine methylase